jgi:UDP-2,3-diacylglucosamine pyrophosphatase LpxH
VLFLDSGEDKPDASKEYSGLVDFDAYIEEELAWLKREIACEAFRQAAWRVVVVHIPPDWRKEDARLWHGERRMRERFAPLFDEGQVHVVISGHTHKAEQIEPCPDTRRGFRWPVFIGGAHPYTNATVIRVDATAKALKVACVRSDGAVASEKSWAK